MDYHIARSSRTVSNCTSLSQGTLGIVDNMGTVLDKEDA